MARPILARRAWQALLTAALMLSTLLLAATPAFAHGGDLLVRQTAGSYTVGVYVQRIYPDTGPAIDLTVFVHHARTGFPVNDAEVTLEVKRGGQGWQTLGLISTANSYHTVVAPGPGEEITTWPLRVEVRAAAGTARVTYTPAQPGRVGGIVGWALVGVTALAVLVLLVQSGASLRRRARQAAASTVTRHS